MGKGTNCLVRKKRLNNFANVVPAGGVTPDDLKKSITLEKEWKVQAGRRKAPAPCW